MALFYDTDFVVLVAFVLFAGLIWYYDAHKTIFSALDARAERIRHELDEAKRLREEAQSLLASYERKQREVEEQASAIVARAKDDANAAAEEAKAKLKSSIERRLRAAEEQIASAEAAAVREVKDRAVAVAVAAAAETIAKNLDAKAANARIDAAIEEVGRRLN